MDEQKLIELAVAGQSEAVGQLYDQYFDAIYRFFYWQTNRQKQESEDLTHDTFIEMAKSLKRFKHRSSFKNWLYAIAKNRLKHWLRHKYQAASQPLFESISDTSDWIDEEEQTKKINMIQNILKNLSDLEREIIEYRHLKNYSVAETAAVMNLTPANVKVMTHRAIKKLQNLVVTQPTL